MSPMSELCVAMKTCTISSDRGNLKRNNDMRQRIIRQPILSKVPSNENGESQSPMNHIVSQLMCIERTCQVFAKRIADSLIFSLTAEIEVVSDSLKSESKHLQHTIFTYMDDERFKNIDFALIHARLSQLIVFKLRQQNIEPVDVSSLLEFLHKVRCPSDDVFSSDDERKPNFRNPVKLKTNINQVIDSHVKCLASFICEELTESEEVKGPSISETECNEVWNKASKCFCEWKVDCLERHSKRNASFRKNRSMLSSSPKSESFVKKLVFDQDIGECFCYCLKISLGLRKNQLTV